MAHNKQEKQNGSESTTDGIWKQNRMSTKSRAEWADTRPYSPAPHRPWEISKRADTQVVETKYLNEAYITTKSYSLGTKNQAANNQLFKEAETTLRAYAEQLYKSGETSKVAKKFDSLDAAVTDAKDEIIHSIGLKDRGLKEFAETLFGIAHQKIKGIDGGTQVDLPIRSIDLDFNERIH